MISSLSVLIPTYNDYCLELVKQLKIQADYEVETSDGKFSYEIIVADDGSTNKDVIETNKAVGMLENCRFLMRKTNSGRAAIRNFLVQNARYEYLLFIDCDRGIRNSDFIHTYLQCEEAPIIYGGYIINDNKDKFKYNLRYIYESKYNKNHIAKQRTKHPYNNFNTSNFIAKRDIMLRFKFDERMKKYGYEDVLWGKIIKENNIKIYHIDNPLIIEEFETNDVFIAKTEEALSTLYDYKEELRGFSSLISTAELLERYNLDKAVAVIFNKIQHIVKNNLTGNKPHITLFYIYKIGIFCKLLNS
ncbi:MAG: glycosyltransferase family 2 protein [Prevotella sp.]